MRAFLNTPITRQKALIAVAISQVGTIVTYVTAKQLLKRGDAIIADQNERLDIYSESAEFLMERASDSTLEELEAKLDFWRIIREKPRTNS